MYRDYGIRVKKGQKYQAYCLGFSDYLNGKANVIEFEAGAGKREEADNEDDDDDFYTVISFGVFCMALWPDVRKGRFFQDGDKAEGAERNLYDGTPFQHLLPRFDDIFKDGLIKKRVHI